MQLFVKCAANNNTQKKIFGIVLCITTIDRRKSVLFYELCCG